MPFRSSNASRLALWALVLAYVALFSWLSVSRHRAFMTNAFDLGNVDQAVWNTAHGRPLAFTNWRGVDLDLATDNRLAMHVEPIYFLIAPLYWVWPSPEALLILQTVSLALGAWPVYWLARERLRSSWAGVVFAAVYLLSPSLEAANLWEFHAVTLAAPLLLFAFYYVQRGQTGRFWLFAVLAMATKEEVPAIVFLMGLYIALALRRPRLGLICAGVALAWFAIAVGIIIPAFEGDRSPYLRYYGDLGDGPLELARALVTRPDLVLGKLLNARNLGYLRDLFNQTGFLSLLNPATLSFILPDLAINLLSDHEPMHFVEKYHYVAPMIPGLMISAVLGAAWLSRRIEDRLGRITTGLIPAWALTAALFYHYYHGYTPLARAFEPYQVTEHHRLGKEIARQIPPDAAVSAQPNLNPHVSQRRVLYRFPYIGDAEYVFLDVSSLANKRNMFGDIEAMLRQGEFGIVRAEDGYLLLRRGAPTQPLPDRFFDFARVADPQPAYPATVDFTPPGSSDALLRLIGFDLRDGRHTEMPQTPLRFFLYFQALRPLAEDYAIALYLLDSEGQVIGGMDLEEKPGVQYWYPTSRWRVGETIKLEISDMPWWTAQYPAYRVALGVVRGTDPWDVGARLQPRVVHSRLQMPLTADGTLVELMAFRTDWGGMPVRVERPRHFRPPRMAFTVSDAKWQNGVRLLGYRTAFDRKRSTLDVTLYWQAGDTPSPDYTVFVHLIGPEGLRSQHDGPPGSGEPPFTGGMLPMSSWLPGEVIADTHPIPIAPDVRAGEYWLAVGMYDPATMTRLPLTNGADHIRLDQRLHLK
ncbi:MAG: DUF2079 domain-containing protein [Anaerolineae bacterium]|nr:DUF2079 domain-containing protein [Anaerolineae bacterium]MDW8098742.1 DUF2079 domain-containing protein [Anaerolineae bacterium]